MTSKPNKKMFKFVYNIAKRLYFFLRIQRSKFNRMGRNSAVIGDNFALNFRKAQREYHDNSSVMIDFLKSHSLYDFWLYYVDSKASPHYRMPWGETLMSKFPMDVWIYKTLIMKSNPNLIIEIGTQRGTSALLLKELSAEIGSTLVTFDIITPTDENLVKFKNAGVNFFNTDATTPKAIENILSLGFKENEIRALVIDDGSHDENHVVQSFQLFNQFIPKNGFYVIEDGFTNELLEKEKLLAMEGVREILNTNSDFEIYSEFDDYFLFSAYMGILQKKSYT